MAGKKGCHNNGEIVTLFSDEFALWNSWVINCIHSFNKYWDYKDTCLLE